MMPALEWMLHHCRRWNAYILGDGIPTGMASISKGLATMAFAVPAGIAMFGPDRIVSELAVLTGETPAQALLPHLIMPAHHDVRSSGVFTRRLHGTLAAAAERGPADFPDLLLIPGVGARTVRSLAMVAEVVRGAPCRFRDPARFSLAHGKDRHPTPSRSRSTTKPSVS
jgi:hypothetical protein